VFLNKGFKTLILFGKAWKLNFAMALEKAFFSSWFQDQLWKVCFHCEPLGTNLPSELSPLMCGKDVLQ
jgi:hypothetical protein